MRSTSRIDGAPRSPQPAISRDKHTGGGLQYVGSATTGSGATLHAKVSARASASSGLATPRFAISALDSITSLPPVLM
jgi:hypothetical protein